MKSKAIAAALAALVLTAGGAVAVGGAQSTADSADTVRDAAVDATYDDGNVTVTVTNGGEAVENATVEVGDEEYTTDANGTVTAAVDADDEFEVGIDADAFSADQEYAFTDGQLTLVEEEYEYPEVEEEEAEYDEDDEDDEYEGDEEDEYEDEEEVDEDEDEEMDDEDEEEDEYEDDDDEAEDDEYEEDDD